MKSDLDDETLDKLMRKFRVMRFLYISGRKFYACSTCKRRQTVQTLYQMDDLYYCSRCIIKKLKERAIKSLFDEI